MKRWILIVLTLFLLSSCKTFDLQPVCRHNATMCMIVAGEKYPTRIATGSTKSGGRHAQAQALIGGKWVWLHFINGYVVIASKDDFNVDGYYYPKHQIRFPYIPSRIGK